MAAIINDGGLLGPLSVEEEGEVVEFGSDRVDRALQSFEHCLVGSFLIEGRVNTWGMKQLFQSIWPEGKQTVIMDARKNLYVLKFPSASSMESVQWGAWVFDSSLLMLKLWVATAKVEEPEWKEMAVWVQVCNLPPYLMTEEDACNAVHQMGKFLDSDPRVMSGEDGNYLRVRARIDIQKLLRRGVFISVKGEKIWLDYRYERIPNLCEWCGRISHLGHACPAFPLKKSNDVPGFGLWLTYRPPRKRKEMSRPKATRDPSVIGEDEEMEESCYSSSEDGE